MDALHQHVHADGFEQVVAELASLELVEAFKDQCFGFLMRLAEELGNDEHHIGALVLERQRQKHSGHDFAVEHQLVGQAGFAVAEDAAGHRERNHVGVGVFDAREDERADLHGGHADFLDGGAVEFGQGIGGLLRKFATAPSAEFLGNHGFHCGDVEVADQNEGHIVGYIIGVEELTHLGGLGILQVLGVADDGTAVRVLAEGFLEHVFLEGVDGTVAVHVLLLIHGFQLALEQTEHGVAEALHIHVHPFGELVRREDVEVHGLVIGSAGIQALAAHLGEDDIHLVRNGVVGRSQRQFVDLVLDGFAFGGIGGLVQTVVHHADAVQIHLFLLPVDGADAVGALEHDMLEIMGHTCSVGGVVLAARMDVDGAVDLGLVVMLAQYDFQAVVEVIGLGLKPRLGGNHSAEQQGDNK